METLLSTQPEKPFSMEPLDIATPDTWEIQRLPLLSLINSILNNKDMFNDDSSCFKSRSFRVGHGPNLKLTLIGSNLQQNKSGDMYPLMYPFGRHQINKNFNTVNIKNVPAYSLITESKGGSQEKFLRIFLENQYKHSDIIDTDCTTPRFMPKDGKESLHSSMELADMYLQSLTSSHKDYEFAHQQKQVFKLAGILWGDNSVEPDALYNDTIFRKEALSDWLIDIVTLKMEEAKRKEARFNDSFSYRPNIFDLLTCRKIEDAISAAFDQGDHRLAMLLTLASNTEESKQIFKNQLQVWVANGVDPIVDESLIRSYVLLSGDLVWLNQDNEVNCCQDLDWKRSFAVHLWYKCQSNCTIKEAVDTYENAFQGADSYTDPPYAPYIENRPTLYNQEVLNCYDSSHYDSCYHLLKLFSSTHYPMNKLFCTTTSSPSELDYRMNWFLYNILSGLGYNISSELADRLHFEFSSQLLVLGMWQWAIFILLHLKHAQGREAAIKNILNLNVELNENAEEEYFLIEKLHVPKNWIYEAKALKAKHLDQPFLEYKFLVRAQIYWKAHEVFIARLAADFVNNEKLSELEEHLGLLSDPEVTARIPEWESKGKLFLEYNELVNLLRSLQEGIIDFNPDVIEPLVIDFAMKVCLLKNGINNTTEPDPKDELCHEKMCEKALTLFHMMIQHHNKLPDNPKAKSLTKTIIKLINQMQLSETMPELNLVFQNYKLTYKCFRPLVKKINQ